MPPIQIDELRRSCFQLIGDFYALLNEFSTVLLDRASDAEASSPPPLPPRPWERVVAGVGIRPQVPPQSTSTESQQKIRDAAVSLRQWYEAQQRGVSGVVKGVYGRAHMAKLDLDPSLGFHDLPATFALVTVEESLHLCTVLTGALSSPFSSSHS